MTTLVWIFTLLAFYLGFQIAWKIQASRHRKEITKLANGLRPKGTQKS